MIKFVKDEAAIPVFVVGTGYGWVSEGREHLETFVAIKSVGNESITVAAKDVPALIEALGSAVEVAAKAAQADLVESKKSLAKHSNK